jgi:Ni/Fe-hydrogenase 1 B-type cytochrome subunit
MAEQNNNNSKTEIKRELEFAATYRWQHWIRALSVFILTLTGFYIAYPFISPAPNPEPTSFMYALFRGWHEIMGFVLVAVFLYKSFLFLFERNHYIERVAFKDIFNLKIWKEQLGYYLFINKHPKLSGVYNPLQLLAYVVFYLMFFGIIITGLILYIHTYHNGFASFITKPLEILEVFMGGLAVVRQWHHILMWGIIIFFITHLYMAVFNAVFRKEGGMDAIFSGLKWKNSH